MLHVPEGAHGFGLVTDSQTGRPSATWGTAITAGVGSKGAWAQISAGLSDPAYGLLININNNSSSGASRDTVLDIGIGAAASELVVIPDLLCGNAAVYSIPGSGRWYWFPLFIPAGAGIAARAQSTSAGGANVFIQFVLRPSNPSMVKVAGFVEAIGIAAGAGTLVTAGTTSEGTWTLLGTTARDCWAWQVGAQVAASDTTHAANIYHVDLAEGDGTTFNLLMDSVILTTDTAERASMFSAMHRRERRVPAGRNIYARAQASATPDPLRIAAYGAGG